MQAAIAANRRKRIAFGNVSQLKSQANEQARQKMKRYDAQQYLPPANAHHHQRQKQGPKNRQCLERQRQQDLLWIAAAQTPAISDDFRVIENEPLVQSRNCVCEREIQMLEIMPLMIVNVGMQPECWLHVRADSYIDAVNVRRAMMSAHVIDISNVRTDAGKVVSMAGQFVGPTLGRSRSVARIMGHTHRKNK